MLKKYTDVKIVSLDLLTVTVGYQLPESLLHMWIYASFLYSTMKKDEHISKTVHS